MTIPEHKRSRNYHHELFEKHGGWANEKRITKVNQIADELERLGGVVHSLSSPHLKALFGDEFDFYSELSDKQLSQWLRHLKTIQHKDEFLQPVNPQAIALKP